MGARLAGLAIAGLVALAPSVASAVPTTTLTNPLVEPSTCAECHEFSNPLEFADEPPVAPMVTWRGSMMANAARDPVFWAGIAIAKQDVAADTTGLLTDATTLCVRCHSPRAFLEGAGLAESADELTVEQREGVECELCHRLVEDPPVPPGNAQYTLDDTLVGMNVPRRGPFAYDPMAPMERRPPHETIQDDYGGTSRACGTCHDVTTPRERLDDAGAPMGMQFNEQRTYSEWLGSVYSQPGAEFQSCQDCHMPAVSDAVGCITFFDEMDPTLLHAEGVRRHELLGANRFMLEILKSEYGNAGAGEVENELYDIAMERMDRVLRLAADIGIDGPDSVDITAGVPDLTVTVTNETGHKLPTGYSEGREMWIEVVATYEDEVLFSSGRWEDGVGRQDDDQVRLYRAVAEEFATGTELHLLLNNHWLEDSRIPPRGLQPDPQTDPITDRYPMQPDGTWANFDEVTYAFAGRDDVLDATPQSAMDIIDIRVRLLYLINTTEYIDFLNDTNTLNDQGMNVASLFEAAGGAVPVVLGEDLIRVPLTGLVGQPGMPGDTGSGTGVGDSAGTGQGDTAGQGGDDGGCGCRRSDGGTGWLWLVPVVAAARRRRSRS